MGLRDQEQNSRIKGILEIPSELELITVLPFGYHTDYIGSTGSRKNRNNLSEIAHGENFGLPVKGSE